MDFDPLTFFNIFLRNARISHRVREHRVGVGYFSMVGAEVIFRGGGGAPLEGGPAFMG